MSATRRRPETWAAFAAGALVMLVIALHWAAWSSRDAGTDLIRAVTRVAGKPGLPIPHLPPNEPRLPDPPRPAPK